jgi:hypothetical protein
LNLYRGEEQERPLLGKESLICIRHINIAEEKLLRSSCISFMPASRSHICMYGQCDRPTLCGCGGMRRIFFIKSFIFRLVLARYMTLFPLGAQQSKHPIEGLKFRK